MPDWGWRILAGLAIMASLVVAYHALFHDRARGRRRCPKCWYYLTPTPEINRCPECGHKPKREQAFYRTRRRWRRLLPIVVFVLGAYILICVPRIRQEGWSAAVPTVVLILIPRIIDDKWAFETLELRFSEDWQQRLDPLSSIERELLTETCRVAIERSDDPVSIRTVDWMLLEYSLLDNRETTAKYARTLVQRIPKTTEPTVREISINLAFRLRDENLSEIDGRALHTVLAETYGAFASPQLEFDLSLRLCDSPFLECGGFAIALSRVLREPEPTQRRILADSLAESIFPWWPAAVNDEAAASIVLLLIHDDPSLQYAGLGIVSKLESRAHTLLPVLREASTQIKDESTRLTLDGAVQMIESALTMDKRKGD